MTAPDAPTPPQSPPRSPPRSPWITSLSARLLVLTITFVMVAEVLIYVPSIARFRMDFLSGRIASAHLAALALEAAPARIVARELEEELLGRAMVRAVVLKRPESRSLILGSDLPSRIDRTYDLRATTMTGSIADAFSTLLRPGRMIRVIAAIDGDDSVVVEMVLEEADLRGEMLLFSGRILTLSIIISLIAATLVYVSLQWLMVRPLRRITQSLIAFQMGPEDESTTVGTSNRRDEIGIAQRELADMQRKLRASLRQRAHLAALGTAVSKINHDLRNILATAQLVSDRLTDSADPEVRRIAPRLVGAIDRAVTLCTNTLRFGRAEEPAPCPQPIDLKLLIDDIADDARYGDPARSVVRNEIAQGFSVVADREQIFRIVLNLVRNSAEALEGAASGTITVRAERVDGWVHIDVIDNGPGVPDQARRHLFEAFGGATRSSGTGLGLAIARDLARGHGGDVRLVTTGPTGTVFRVELPGSRAP